MKILKIKVINQSNNITVVNVTFKKTTRPTLTLSRKERIRKRILKTNSTETKSYIVETHPESKAQWVFQADTGEEIQENYCKTIKSIVNANIKEIQFGEENHY